ncbi:hypothetical protein B0H13DRAFT_2393960 [Mycena leptocephala]|nr:hypothetical protein B0H13DRAFT_2393960 [Mycena leptocephala]
MTRLPHPPSSPPPPYDNDEVELLRLLGEMDLADTPAGSRRAPSRNASPLRQYCYFLSPRTHPSNAPLLLACIQLPVAHPFWNHDILAHAAAETQGVSGASPRRLTPNHRCSGKNRGYAVFRGLAVGSFLSWNEVQPLVIGVSNSSFEGYRSMASAKLLTNTREIAGGRVSFHLHIQSRLLA